MLPIGHPGLAERYFIIVFEEAGRSDLAEQEAPPGPKLSGKEAEKIARRDNRMAQLKKELSSTKEYLQSIIEEQESANEELRSANEEIQSTNEELQSTNEELETAKEELQSTNEELNTVNEELENRNIELIRLNDDLNNLLTSFRIPILILDRGLRIRRFTSMSEKVMNLLPTDIGRPMADIKPNFTSTNLDYLAKEAVDSMSAKEEDVRDQDGRWYTMRILPYRTSDDKIDGVVILFIDIDGLKHCLSEAEESRDYSQAIVAAVGRPMLVLDHDMRVMSASASFYALFDVKPKEIAGNFFHRLLKGKMAVPRLRDQLEELILKGEPFSDISLDGDFERVGYKKLKVGGRPVNFGKENTRMFLVEFEPAAGNNR